MMERDPDIAALAARLGLRGVAYRSFARPAFPRAVAAAPVAATPPVPAPAPVDPSPQFPLLAQVLTRSAAAAAPASAQPFLDLRRLVAGRSDPAEH